jgi:hypothetical protein
MGRQVITKILEGESKKQQNKNGDPVMDSFILLPSHHTLRIASNMFRDSMASGFT